VHKPIILVSATNFAIVACIQQLIELKSQIIYALGKNHIGFTLGCTFRWGCRHFNVDVPPGEGG